MLEELFGGGHTSPPANNNTNTQPATAPSSPRPSEPTAGSTEPAEDDTVDDGMPADHDDGTYSSTPVTDDNPAEETTAAQPAEQPDSSDPVAPEKEAETPVATTPSEQQDEETGSDTPAATEPAATAPSQPAPAPSPSPSPSNDNSAAPQPSENTATDTTVTTAVAPKPDPVARITDLIATYEKLLSEPDVDENAQARTRAMELAQNRTLTSLLDNLSSSDARAIHTPLDDNSGTDQVSLITKYYAEAGR